MKKLIYGLLFFPVFCYGQLAGDDPIRQAAVETLYAQGKFYESATSDIPIDMDLINSLANQAGYCSIFLGDSFCTANQVVLTSPPMITYSQESAFLAEITDTVTTMSQYAVSGGELSFGNLSIWQELAGGATIMVDALSLVGAGPGSAGTTETIPDTGNGKLSAFIDSVSSVHALGITEVNPATTAPTLSNPLFFAQMQTDGCVDILVSGSVVQDSAVCGVAVGDLLAMELRDGSETVGIYHTDISASTRRLVHTFAKGSAFATAYGAAYITTADSDAIDEAALTTSFSISEGSTIWDTLDGMTTSGKDLTKSEATSGDYTTADAQSDSTVLEGDYAVLTTVADSVVAADNWFRFGLTDRPDLPITGSSIEYQLSHTNGEFRAYESGTERFGGAISPGDLMSLVHETDGTVTFLQNDTLRFTSVTAPPAYPLTPVALLWDTGGKLRNAQIDITRRETTDADFEDQLFTNLRVGVAGNGNTPTIESATPNAAYGTYYMESVVDREVSATANRTEASIADPDNTGANNNFTLGREHWMGVSIQLPSDYADCNCGWDIVWQLHDTPDIELGELDTRNPIMALDVNNGNWDLPNRWDSKINTTVSGSVVYDGTRSFDLGSTSGDLGNWVDWIFRIKLAYDNTGILEVWKDGVNVVSSIGAPNAFNDLVGPYWKLGSYNGMSAGCCTGGQQIRTVYHDSVRVQFGVMDTDDFDQKSNNSPFALTSNTQAIDERIQIDPSSAVDGYAITTSSGASTADIDLTIELLQTDQDFSIGITNDVTPTVVGDLDYSLRFNPDATIDVYAGVGLEGTNVATAEVGSTYRIFKDFSAGEVYVYKDAGLVDTITGQTFSTTMSGAVYVEVGSENFLIDNSVYTVTP